MSRRALRAAARTRNALTIDTAVFSGTSTVCLLLALPGWPVASALAGVALLIGIQGLAGTAAVLPQGAARRGFTAVSALVGVLLTILVTVAVDALGIPLTRTSTLVAGYVTAVVLLLVAGIRRTVPALVYDPRTVPSGAVVVVGLTVAAAVAVHEGASIGRFLPEAYSSVAFSGALERVDGVVGVRPGQTLPVQVTISNATGAARHYRIAWDAGTGTARPVVDVTVAGGTSRPVEVAAVTVPDGCVHRFVVQVSDDERDERYLLTLYAQGTGVSCPR